MQSASRPASSIARIEEGLRRHLAAGDIASILVHVARASAPCRSPSASHGFWRGRRTNSARAAAHQFQIDGAARSAASGGDCWPCISVPGSGSSSDGGRLLLASLLMGTFRQWLMVNAGAPIAVIQSVAGVGVQTWSSGQPEATRCNNSSINCCSFCSRNRRDFQVCATDLDLVSRPDQRFDASSLAILALVETGPSCPCHRGCRLCTLQGRKGTLGCR